MLLYCITVSCINQHHVKVEIRNFGDEIGVQQNLSFTFNRDLVPDSLTGIWDTLSYLSITPAVQGKYKWNSPRELVFSPVNGFSPSTGYTISLTKNILKYNSPLLDIGEGVSFKTHTPYLDLEDGTAFWTVSESYQNAAALLVTLTFNYPVDPVVVSQLSSVSLGGKATEFTLKSNTASENVTYLIDNIPLDRVETMPVSVEINPGLSCLNSDYHTTGKITRSVSVPSPGQLEISQVLPEYENSESFIHVYTNQAVDATEIKEHIKLDPQLPFTIRPVYNGFIIGGDFSSGTAYQVTITKNMKGLLGGFLNSDYSTSLSFGEMEPSISFVSQKAMYLSSRGSKNIAVRISSLPQVRVTIWKIYENNIQHFLKNNRYTDSWYDDEGEYNTGGYNYSVYEISDFGDKIMDKVYQTRDLAVSNGTKLLNLNFDETGAYHGVYLIQVASDDRQWLSDTRLIAVSDIGMIVKQGENDVYVFLNSILSTQPLEGVKVSLVSNNNQVMMTARSDRDGVAKFSEIRNRKPDFTPSMITVTSEKDFNFISFRDSRVNNSRFDVGGRRPGSSGLMAFMYGDRSIYRPGETIRMNSIVRTETWMKQSGLPVKIRLIMPNGKEFRSVRGNLDAQGSLESSFELPGSALTGNYSVELLTSNEVLIASKYISVEEFLPDRIDLRLSLSRESLETGDSLRAEIAALNYFGPPAAGRKYEMDFSVTRKAFNAKNFPGYSFDITTGNNLQFTTNDVREGTTNSEGKAGEVFKAPPEWKDQGLLSCSVHATVFDETGRPVNRVKEFPVFTQNTFFGIRMDDRYVNRGEALRIPLAAVNHSGKGVAAKALVKVVRFDWYTSLEKDEYGSRVRYVSRKKEVILQERNLDIAAGGTNYDFTPGESGEYEIRISTPGSKAYVTSDFYAFGWGYTSNTSFQVNPEGQVDIVADKDAYQMGENAILIFKTPFNGRLLITMECDKVIEYRYINTESKTARIEVPLKESYMPNIYITATLFRSLDDQSIPLTVAHGFLSLKVDKPSCRMPVSLTVNSVSRSKTKQTVTLKTLPGKNIKATIAVVDEGILAIRQYKTPDPYGYFYQKKALTVQASDVYPYLFPDLKLQKSSTGGDQADREMMSGRVNPLSNKRVKLVSCWSGILDVNDNGTVTYTFDIPQFSGDLRVMACVYRDQAFGSADTHIRVADPVIISPSIPRFLSPGDTLNMPVTLTNTTKKSSDAVATVRLSGPLKMAGSNTVATKLDGGLEQKVVFRIVADGVWGAGAVDIQVKAMNETFSDHTDISVRPVTSLLKTNGSGTVSGMGRIQVTNDFIPSTVRAKLVISQNPVVQFSRPLSYLLGYPFGCLEQTVSKAFPQIYFSDLARNMKYAASSDMNPAANVQTAIRKIEGMQVFNGGFSFWPGGDQVSWWGSNYALHFLAEARKAGYEVRDQVVQRALSYIAQKVKEHNVEKNYRYLDGSGVLEERSVFSKENFYALYLLAVYGKPDISTMNYYKAHLDRVALDGRYLLACSYLASGDRNNYELLVPTSFQGERSISVTGGSFYSYIRDEAIALNALLETDPGNRAIPQMVRHLSKAVSDAPYLNTQEAAFSFLALGKFSRKNAMEKISATITAEGLPAEKFSGKDVILTNGINGKPVDVSITGPGNLYYFWEAEGLSSSGNVKEEDKFLQIRKSFYNRFGQPVTSMRFKQGDLIIVKLTLTNLERSRLDNIIITDMLPAGFEIENPRITETTGLSWVKNQSQPDYMDVRDDRIHFFTSVDQTAGTYYYMVRAVSTGKFRMGPVSADAMYNGEYHSYYGSGMVTVE